MTAANSGSALTLQPDFNQAERYLSILDEEADAFCYQTFDDLKSRKNKALASIRQGSFEQWGGFLGQMNQSGAGIFVTVNETDGKGRQLSNIVRIRAIFHEEDTPCHKQFPLDPHLLIESSPGKFHRYWLVDGLSQADFTGVMLRMIKDYGSDPNVKDTARVLRIPGFFHQKDPAHPFMVRIVEESGGLPYSAEAILAAFPPVVNAQVIPMARTAGALNDGAARSLVAELASRAARRTHEDKSKGRSAQVLWLGFECATRGVPVDYAEYAVTVFAKLMRATDTAGKPAEMHFESEVNAFKRSYAKGLGKPPSAIERYELPVAVAADQAALAEEHPKVRLSRKELEQLIEDTEDFEALTEVLPMQVANAGLVRPAIEYLLGKLAKKASVPKSSLLDVIRGFVGGGDNGAAADNGDGRIDELNLKHAILPIGGRVLILNRDYDPVMDRELLTFSAKTDFETRYCNRKMYDKGDEVGLGTYWLNHPRRAEFDGMVFSPGKDEPGYLNLWAGWGIEPAAGSCRKYLDFVAEVICAGDGSLYDYVLSWCAHLLQRPQELPETALVFRGREGIGKNTFIDPLRDIVGREHFLMLSSLNQITGRFSGHLANALLVFCNESVWGGDKSAQGVLKSMITDDVQPIEHKGRDLVMVKSYRRMIFATNENWAVPRGADDRRYIVTDVLDTYKGNYDYFNSIREEMKNGGTEALMHYLLNLDISHWHPRNIPEHLQKRGWELKIRSGGSIVQWWYDVLQQGWIEKLEGHYADGESLIWPAQCPADTLQKLYLAWCLHNKVPHPEHSVVLGKAIHDWGVRTARPRHENPNRKLFYKFPVLTEAQALFSKRFSIPDEVWADHDNGEIFA